MMLGSQCSQCCQNCCINSRWLVAPPSKCGEQVIAELADASFWPVGSTLSDLVSVAVDGIPNSPVVTSRTSTSLSAGGQSGEQIPVDEIVNRMTFQISRDSTESPSGLCYHPRFFGVVLAKGFTFTQFQLNDTIVVLSINIQVNAGRFAFATFAAVTSFRDSYGNFISSREPSEITVSFAGTSVGFSYPPTNSSANTVYVGFLNRLRSDAILRPANSFFDLRNEVGAFAIIEDDHFRGTLSGSIATNNYGASRGFSVSLKDEFFEGCESCNPLP